MSTITVELGERAYPIIIESNALCNAQALQQAIKGKTVLIVSNTTVAPLYAERMAQLVRDLGMCTNCPTAKRIKIWKR